MCAGAPFPAVLTFVRIALAYHNAQLEASAFREEYDAEAFEDLTAPKAAAIHRRAGPLVRAWKEALVRDESAERVVAGTKRKAVSLGVRAWLVGSADWARWFVQDVGVDEAEVRSKYEAGALGKASSLSPKRFFGKLIGLGFVGQMRVDQLKVRLLALLLGKCACLIIFW